MKHFYHILLLLSYCLVLSGSLEAEEKNNTRELYLRYCSSCHGDSGQGDGVIADSLPENMKPANLQKGDFKKVDDPASMKKMITEGGATLGLSPIKVPQSGLSDIEINQIIEYVNSLKEDK